MKGVAMKEVVHLVLERLSGLGHGTLLDPGYARGIFKGEKRLATRESKEKTCF